MSPLHFTLSIKGLEDESLVVRRFEGQENFSDEPFYWLKESLDREVLR